MDADTRHPGDRHDGGAEGRGEQGRHHALGRLPVQAYRGKHGHTPTAKPFHISERHRHRYEFNNAYLEAFTGRLAWRPPGINPKGKLVEIVELKGHPWFVGVQFHPEYRSTVMKPHALFRSACG
jgi:CTP synthase